MPIFTKTFATVVSLIAVAGAFVFAQGDAAKEEKAKPKHTIEVVMEKAMKGGLNKKVMSGNASTEEKLALLDMYVSLVENKPPIGENASWQRLSGQAALAAAKVVVGREGAENELKAATNCKACHDVHKPKEEE